MSKQIFSKKYNIELTPDIINDIIDGEYHENRNTYDDYLIMGGDDTIVKIDANPQTDNIKNYDEIVEEVPNDCRGDVEEELVCLDIPDGYQVIMDYVQFDMEYAEPNHIVILGKDIKVLNLSQESTYKDLVVPFKFE